MNFRDNVPDNDFRPTKNNNENILFRLNKPFSDHLSNN